MVNHLEGAARRKLHNRSEAIAKMVSRIVRDDDDTQVISWIHTGSPAQHSGLSAQDKIVAIDGTTLGESKMDDILEKVLLVAKNRSYQ